MPRALSHSRILRSLSSCSSSSGLRVEGGLLSTSQKSSMRLQVLTWKGEEQLIFQDVILNYYMQCGGSRIQPTSQQFQYLILDIQRTDVTVQALLVLFWKRMRRKVCSIFYSFCRNSPTFISFIFRFPEMHLGNRIGHTRIFQKAVQTSSNNLFICTQIVKLISPFGPTLYQIHLALNPYTHQYNFYSLSIPYPTSNLFFSICHILQYPINAITSKRVVFGEFHRPAYLQFTPKLSASPPVCGCIGFFRCLDACTPIAKFRGAGRTLRGHPSDCGLSAPVTTRTPNSGRFVGYASACPSPNYQAPPTSHHTPNQADQNSAQSAHYRPAWHSYRDDE